jgi:hypothetical protein
VTKIFLLSYQNLKTIKKIGTPYNLSGNWSGVMGDVVKGKYPISLSAWSWMPERNYFLDFVPIIKENFVLSIVPQQPKVDLTLFIRPFRRVHLVQ